MIGLPVSAGAAYTDVRVRLHRLDRQRGRRLHGFAPVLFASRLVGVIGGCLRSGRRVGDDRNHQKSNAPTEKQPVHRGTFPTSTQLARPWPERRCAAAERGLQIVRLDKCSVSRFRSQRCEARHSVAWYLSHFVRFGEVPKMRVLIADKFEEAGRAGLAAAGCDVSYQPDVKEETLLTAIRAEKADVVIVRSTKVTEPMLDAGPVKLIVRAGAGYNTIDVAAASKRGIYVSNCPGQNSVAVAELAFGLILALDRRIPDNVAQLRDGRWNKAEFSKARGLHGRTLGLIGVGRIGGEMIPRARAFGMRVVGWSHGLTPEAASDLGIGRAETPEEAAARSDIVSVHLALNAETRGLLSTPFFDAMRPGALFLNTARGEIVDEAALATAMKERGIRAGLDVFANEPAGGTAEFQPAIAALPGLYGTHHIGASTEQAQEAIAADR